MQSFFVFLSIALPPFFSVLCAVFSLCSPETERRELNWRRVGVQLCAAMEDLQETSRVVFHGCVCLILF